MKRTEPRLTLACPSTRVTGHWGFSACRVIEKNAFDENHVRLLQTLASNMGIAIANARLFDETQRLLKVTEDRAAELGAISKVSQALIAEPDLDSTIQLIGNQMQEIFNADIVYVALLDPETKLIHFPYQFGESFTTLTLGEGLTSKIIETGEPLLINQDVDGARRRDRGNSCRQGCPVLSWRSDQDSAGHHGRYQRAKHDAGGHVQRQFAPPALHHRRQCRRRPA